jgi:hypothetical protein
MPADSHFVRGSSGAGKEDRNSVERRQSNMQRIDFSFFFFGLRRTKPGLISQISKDTTKITKRIHYAVGKYLSFMFLNACTYPNFVISLFCTANLSRGRRRWE